MQFYKCSLRQVVASMVPRLGDSEFRLGLVHSRMVWVEGSFRLHEELLVGGSEEILRMPKCTESLLLALPSGKETKQ